MISANCCDVKMLRRGSLSVPLYKIQWISWIAQKFGNNTSNLT